MSDEPFFKPSDFETVTNEYCQHDAAYDANQKVQPLVEERDALLDRLASAEDALEFYAENNNYRAVQRYAEGDYATEADHDGGKRARQHFEKWGNK